MTENLEREPTADEAAGIAWWNSIPERQRAFWLELTHSGSAAEAWTEYKRRLVGKRPGPASAD